MGSVGQSPGHIKWLISNSYKKYYKNFAAHAVLHT